MCEKKIRAQASASDVNPLFLLSKVRLRVRTERREEEGVESALE